MSFWEGIIIKVSVIYENKKLLDLIATTLLEYETITKEQIDYLVKHGCMPDDDKEVDESDFKEASLKDLSLKELQEIAHEKDLEDVENLSKEELVEKLEGLEK